MSKNNNDIDMDMDQDSLYDYINELDQIVQTIKYTPPKNPSTFGNMSEPFKGSKKNKNDESFFSHNFLVFIVIAIVLLVVGFMIMNFGPCGNSEKPEIPVNDYIDTYAPIFGSEMRAVLVR